MMPLEQQVCALEYSKRFKELGVRQESIFFWDVHSPTAYAVTFVPYSCPGLERYSAFTVAELGEMLPKKIDKYVLTISYEPDYTDPDNVRSRWHSYYFLEEAQDRFLVCIEDRLADSMAQLLDKTIENGNVKAEDL
jgi:hypothetical protein